MGCVWSNPPSTEANGRPEISDKKQYSWYLFCSFRDSILPIQYTYTRCFIKGALFLVVIIHSNDQFSRNFYEM